MTTISDLVVTMVGQLNVNKRSCRLRKAKQYVLTVMSMFTVLWHVYSAEAQQDSCEAGYESVPFLDRAGNVVSTCQPLPWVNIDSAGNAMLSIPDSSQASESSGTASQSAGAPSGDSSASYLSQARECALPFPGRVSAACTVGTQPGDYNGQMVTSNSEYMYVFGGCTYQHVTNSLHLLELSSMRWSLPRLEGDSQTTPAGRCYGAMAVTGQYLVIHGGVDARYNPVQGIAVLQTNTFTWVSRSISQDNAPSQFMAFHTMFATSASTIAMIGYEYHQSSSNSPAPLANPDRAETKAAKQSHESTFQLRMQHQPPPPPPQQQVSNYIWILHLDSWSWEVVSLNSSAADSANLKSEMDFLSNPAWQSVSQASRPLPWLQSVETTNGKAVLFTGKSLYSLPIDSLAGPKLTSRRIVISFEHSIHDANDAVYGMQTLAQWTEGKVALFGSNSSFMCAPETLIEGIEWANAYDACVGMLWEEPASAINAALFSVPWSNAAQHSSPTVAVPSLSGVPVLTQPLHLPIQALLGSTMVSVSGNQHVLVAFGTDNTVYIFNIESSVSRIFLEDSSSPERLTDSSLARVYNATERAPFGRLIRPIHLQGLAPLPLAQYDNYVFAAGHAGCWVDIFNVSSMIWRSIEATGDCPSVWLVGVGFSSLGDGRFVLIGGVQLDSVWMGYGAANSHVRILDCRGFQTCSWALMQSSGMRPNWVYGSAVVTMDLEHVAVLGGSSPENTGPLDFLFSLLEYRSTTFEANSNSTVAFNLTQSQSQPNMQVWTIKLGSSNCTWSALATQTASPSNWPAARWGHVAQYVNSKWIVFGGSTGFLSDPPGVWSGEVSIQPNSHYSVVWKVKQTSGTSPPPTVGFASAVQESNRLVLFGGAPSSSIYSVQGDIFSSMYSLDLETFEWVRANERNDISTLAENGILFGSAVFLCFTLDCSSSTFAVFGGIESSDVQSILALDLIVDSLDPLHDLRLFRIPDVSVEMAAGSNLRARILNSGSNPVIKFGNSVSSFELFGGPLVLGYQGLPSTLKLKGILPAGVDRCEQTTCSTVVIPADGCLICDASWGCTSMQFENVVISGNNVRRMPPAPPFIAVGKGVTMCISGCTVRGIHTRGDGGVLTAVTSASVTISKSFFQDLATEGAGGVAFSLGAAINLSDCAINNCRSAAGCISAASQLLCNFDRTNAKQKCNLQKSNFQISDLVVKNCFSSGTGAVLQAFGANGSIANTVVTNTSAVGSGGAIASVVSTLSIWNLSATNSESQNGGGVIMAVGASHANLIAWNQQPRDIYDVISPQVSLQGRPVSAIIDDLPSSILLSDVETTSSKALFGGSFLLGNISTSLSTIKCVDSLTHNQRGGGGCLFLVQNIDDPAPDIARIQAAIQCSLSGSRDQAAVASFGSCLASSPVAMRLPDSINSTTSSSQSSVTRKTAGSSKISSRKNFNSVTKVDVRDSQLIHENQGFLVNGVSQRNGNQKSSKMNVYAGQQIEPITLKFLDAFSQVVVADNKSIVQVSISHSEVLLSGRTTASVNRGVAQVVGLSINFPANLIGQSVSATLDVTLANLGTVSAALNMHLIACPAGFYDSNFGTRGLKVLDCEACRSSTYALHPVLSAAACNSCPTGAICDGGNSVVADTNYYRSSDFASGSKTVALITPCITASACEGNNTCKQGHTGRLCSQCLDGYAFDGAECLVCTGNIVIWRSLLGILVGFLFGIALYVFSIRPSVWWVEPLVLSFVANRAPARVRHLMIKAGLVGANAARGMMEAKRMATRLKKMRRMRASFKMLRQVRSGAAKITITFFQVISTVSTTVFVAWPAAFSDLLNVAGLFTLDLIEFPGISCVTSVLSFQDSLVIYTFVPLSMMALSVIVQKIVIRKARQGKLPAFWTQKFRGDVDLFEEQMIDRGWNAMFWLMFLIYPAASAKAIESFACVDLKADGSWMLADMSISCSSQTRQATVLIGVICTLVHPLGLPLAFAYCIKTLKVKQVSEEKVNDVLLQEAMEHDIRCMSSKKTEILAAPRSPSQTDTNRSIDWEVTGRDYSEIDTWSKMKDDENVLRGFLHTVYVFDAWTEFNQNGDTLFTPPDLRTVIVNINDTKSKSNLGKNHSKKELRPPDRIFTKQPKVHPTTNSVDSQNSDMLSSAGKEGPSNYNDQTMSDDEKAMPEPHPSAPSLDNTLKLPSPSGPSMPSQEFSTAGLDQNCLSPSAPKITNIRGVRRRPVAGARPTNEMKPIGRGMSMVDFNDDSLHILMTWYLNRANRLQKAETIAIPPVLWNDESGHPWETRILNRLGFLIDSFECDVWYWEFLELIRKLLLSSIGIFLWQASATKIVVGVVVNFTALYMTLRKRPFASPLLDDLQAHALVAQVAISFYGLLLFVEATPTEGPAAVVLTIAMYFLVLSTVFLAGRILLLLGGKAIKATMGSRLRAMRRRLRSVLGKTQADDGTAEISTSKARLVLDQHKSGQSGQA